METDVEKRMVEVMIRLYCKKKEKNAQLCPACKELLEYATARLDSCPFGDKKGTCKDCRIHCYKPEMRERIRTVMRFSGPRLIFYSPIMAIRHLLWGRKSTRQHKCRHVLTGNLTECSDKTCGNKNDDEHGQTAETAGSG